MKGKYGTLIYPLLIFLITGPACSLASDLATRFGQRGEPTPTRPRRYVVLPPAPVTVAAPAEAGPTSAPDLVQDSFISPLQPDPAESIATTSLPAATEALAPPSLDPSGQPPAEASPPVAAPPSNPAPTSAAAHPPRPTATPTLDNFASLFAQLASMFNEPTATPTSPLRLAMLPTPLPTPTDTATPTPTFTPLPTDTPTATATPIPLPVDTPTPVPTDTPIPAPVSAPVQAPPPAVESAFTSPLAAPAPEAGHDFLLAEFYNSPTTNSFMVMYVAIVDANEIPIGDMKVVGTRLDHNLTYQSPLSTWHYEGYNAPGEVIKSGNVKFEPPGGIETTHWILHLEDAHGNRMSEDIPFDTDQKNKQWYFIKLKRKF